jgi:ribonuclease HII
MLARLAQLPASKGRAMAWLIGTDEAGYGPNLGPLVVSATLWRLPDISLARDLYDMLADVVCRTPRTGDPRLPIADSKQLYSPGVGLAALEQAVLAAQRVAARRTSNPSRTAKQPADLSSISCGTRAGDPVVRRTGATSGLRADTQECMCWRDIWPVFDSRFAADFDSTAWYADYNTALPCDATLDALEQYADMFAKGLEDAEVELVALCSRVVCEARFNDLLDGHGNKATLLSRVTLELVDELLASLADGPVLIHCDKHGGRNHYGALLQQTFPEYLVEVRGECRAQSIYRFGPRRRRVEMRFTAGGESELPAALASMTSKYLRELAMRAFNDYWLREVPGIRPTAGYPADARRFHQSIAARQAELGIGDRALWRRS